MMGRLSVRRALPRDAGAIAALLDEADLEREIVPDQFLVAEALGQVIACARLKPLAGGGHELASVAVERRLRAHGVGKRLVEYALAVAGDPVYALAIAPAFFERVGFRAIPEDELPPDLLSKARGACASRGFVAMRLARDAGGGDGTG